MMKLEEAIAGYVNAIKNTPQYREYICERERLRENPGLKAQIEEYCRLNFELQNDKNASYERLEAFERDYADFRERPEVDAYLSAELAFCRLMQDIDIRVTDGFDLD